jgi:VWFA-related protein
MHEKLHTADAGPQLKRSRLGFWAVAALLVLVAATGLDAGQGGQPAPRVQLGTPPSIAQQVEDMRDMVTLYVSVTDRQGNAIAGLKPANFVIWEDDVEQEIAEFLMDMAPVSLGVVFGPNIPIGDTIPAFLKASAPNTEFFLVGNDTVIAPFSTDVKKAPRVIAQNDMEIFPSGGRDAMHIGLDVLSEASAYVRRVMLVVGRANRANPVAQPAFGNGVTYDSLANTATKGGMQIYTIIVSGRAPDAFAGLPPASINPSGMRNAPGLGQQQQQNTGIAGMTDINNLGQMFDESMDSIALDGLAALTGGRSYLIQNTDTGIGNDTSELEAVADEIARGLRVQYRIGYHPTNREMDGKWRALRVTLVDMPKEVPTKLNLWTKTGYYAPRPPKKK